jgi:NAD(P)-dependent dehydrogenase (short-subunit alcohol dehydrogenase family)
MTRGTHALFDLSGKVAVVTGGSSGIGLGYATGLAEAGADLSIWSIDDAANEKAAAELRRHGGRVLALHCDVRDPAQIEETFARTVRELGRVDACFANAGVPPRFVPSGELTLDEWRRMTGIHLEGSFFTLRTAFRHMAERGEGGSLVGTSSTSAVSGTANAAHYAAAKAGVLAVLKSLAVEGARHRIRANAIIPGWIDTAFAGGMYQTEVFEKRVLPRIPLRRVGTSDDFKAIAVYLASDASGYHTGDELTIDGGYRCF